MLSGTDPKRMMDGYLLAEVNGLGTNLNVVLIGFACFVFMVNISIHRVPRSQKEYGVRPKEEILHSRTSLTYHL